MIPDGMVDAVICDLPYGVLHRNNPNAQWDRMIPMEPLWEQYKRVTKPNAAIVLFAQGMFTAQLMMSNPKMWRYNLVWDKGRATGFLNANRMPLRYHEDICVFYQKLPTYNPQMEDLNGREPNHPQGHGDHVEKNSCYGKVGRINPTYEDKKYPRSIITVKAVHCNEEQFHPTQKPIELIRYLIRTYTNSGGGNIGQLHGQWHDCHRLSEGKAALRRLRAEQGVFRQGAGAHRTGTTTVDAVLGR